MKNDSKKATKKVAKKVPKKVSKRATKKATKPDKVTKHKYTRRTPKAEQNVDINDLNLDVSVIGDTADNPIDLDMVNHGTQVHTLLNSLFTPGVDQFSGGEYFVMNAETKASNQRAKVISAIRELVEATIEMQKSRERSAGELAIATAEQATAAVKVKVALDTFEAVIRGTPSEG